MKNPAININLLYYTEKNECIVHCPELAIMGVSRIPDTYHNIEEVVIAAFFEKLNNRIKRFPSPEAFFENLVKLGIWVPDNNGNPLPQSLDHYKRQLPYLNDTLNHSTSDSVTLSYDLPIKK